MLIMTRDFKFDYQYSLNKTKYLKLTWFHNHFGATAKNNLASSLIHTKTDIMSNTMKRSAWHSCNFVALQTFWHYSNIPFPNF